MHYAVAAEAVNEIQPGDTRRFPDDRVMVRSHLIKPGPGATRIDFRFSQTRHASGGASQYLFYKARIEFGLEARRFLGIVPGQQYPFALAAEVKTGRHVDHH